MERDITVRVYSDDERLQRALTARLEQLEGVIVCPGPGASTQDVDPRLRRPCGVHSNERPAVVVAPASDLSLAQCSQFAKVGLRVIVLAPVLREQEEARYLRAGAYAYLGMAVDNRELMERIASIAAVSVAGT